MDGTRFRDVSDQAGPGITAPEVRRGCACGDFDSDGRVDVVANQIDDTLSLLGNEMPTEGGWLSVKCVGRRSNRSAIGARVTVQIGGVASGSSYHSQNDLRLHFGLGRRGKPTRWKCGGRQETSNVARACSGTAPCASWRARAWSIRSAPESDCSLAQREAPALPRRAQDVS